MIGAAPDHDEYYNDSPTLDNADDVAVTAASTTAGIDAVLTLAGHITGTVTNGTKPLPNIYAIAFRYNGSNWESFRNAMTDAGGVYDINGLATGTYRVMFSGSSGYISEYYNDVADMNSANDVIVTAGSTTAGIDAILATAGHITGTVTDGSNPLPWIDVTTYRYNGSNWESFGGTMTDASGLYDIGGLATGVYRVKYRSGTYAFEYYNDSPTLGNADDVAVTAGSTTSGIDAILVTAGHITGTVTDGTKNPLDTITVSAYRYNGSDWEPVMGGPINASGVYDLGGLATGAYRVGFLDESDTYRLEYYDNAPDLDSADDVVVTAGSTTSGIDALLSIGYDSYLPVILK